MRKGRSNCGGEVARAHLAQLICNQTLSLSSFPTMSPDSVDGSWDKASILYCPRSLLVLFQASALRHRPFCMEHPKTAVRERTGGRSKYWEGRGGEARGGVEKVGGGFVDGQTAFSIPSLPSLPSSCCCFLSLDCTPGPFASNMLQCSATPHLAPWKDSRLHRSHCLDQESWSWPFPLHHPEQLHHSNKNI